jgi:hypothetical protein
MTKNNYFKNKIYNANPKFENFKPQNLGLKCKLKKPKPNN